ncbi:MAG: hypothetical protein V2J25_05210 [Desulfatiglans sp.]|jgi:hypothetical protein|nr:hypothetical protein [Thermodesulfobacteriota bacterium]MEE4352250.1 hypothetical protein [Desulfatiglans sp.]
MNWHISIAGFIALFTTIGHFAIGNKQFLRPMLETSFDPVAKKTMHCVFHYVSAYLILSSVALLLIGFNVWPSNGTNTLILFIGVNYLVFAVWQIVLSTTSDIPRGVFKLFQWIFFVLIALFSFLGICP